MTLYCFTQKVTITYLMLTMRHVRVQYAESTKQRAVYGGAGSQEKRENQII